jgi:septum formation protein
MPDQPARIILASSSRTRRELLARAGVPFEVIPSRIDEDELRARLAEREPTAGPARIAEILAWAKAEDVSRAHPTALVIGADQTLNFEGRLLNKANDRVEARRRLLDLRGRDHILHSAVAIATAGVASWTCREDAALTMRMFSDSFLDRYLEAAGNAAVNSVGAYELESTGIQLFERVDGDYFTILGLPLIPLLAELRRRGAMAS